MFVGMLILLVLLLAALGTVGYLHFQDKLATQPPIEATPTDPTSSSSSESVLDQLFSAKDHAKLAAKNAAEHLRRVMAKAQQAIEEQYIVPGPYEDMITVPGFGVLLGRVGVGHKAFLGVPYAQPPIGELRWRPPQPLQSFSEDEDDQLPVYECKRFKPACLQHSSKPQSEMERLLLGVKHESEDCLYLNVFVPRDYKLKKNLPVLVFIHGGAFTTGASSSPLYNPIDLLTTGLENEAVVVTLDYRLGVFGWAAGSALLSSSDEPVGNYGLQDQMAAIKWVRRHISAFHGDPLNVTVMGHSAGAICTSYLQLLEPQLAAKWVLMSGTAFGWKWRRAGSRFENRVWKELAERVGVGKSDLAGMRAVGADKLVAACNQIHGDYLFGPTIDGRLIQDEPVNLVPSARIGPTIVTTVKDEASVFLGKDDFKNPIDSIKAIIRDKRVVESMVRMMRDEDPVGSKGLVPRPNAVSAALTDTLFTAPSLFSYTNHLATNLSLPTLYRTLFDHPLALPSFASVVATGHDYGVFHGSDIVLLFNFNPLMAVPSWTVAAEMRAGLRRFLHGSGEEGAGVWGEESERVKAAKVRYEKYWKKVIVRPPLAPNFRSTLPLLE
jgi:carboxylesterase type B